VVGVAYNVRLQEEKARTEGALKDAEQARDAEAVARSAENMQRQRAENALYFNRIVLAEREWWAGNVGRSLQLLADCPADLHGWEWDYLHRLCHTELRSFPIVPQTQEALFNLALSPDGKMLASGAPEKCAKVWDAATGRELHTLRGHTADVCGV